jgi:glycine oxidase
MTRYDILIIGNGILGSAVAFALAERAPALKVALIGPAARAGSASMAAGAMLNAFGEIEAGSLAHPLQRAKFALAREALRLWPAWHRRLANAAGLAEEPGIRPGTVILRPSASSENYEAILAALDEAGEPYSLIDPRAIEGYRPAAPPSAEAIHIPGEGSVDPRRLFDLFARAFARAETVMPVDRRVQSIRAEASGSMTATLSDGEALTAPKILIAAGAMSGRLIATIPALQDRVQPLLYGNGVALIFRRQRAVPAHVLRVDHPGFDHGIHLVPQAADAIYIGASNDVAGTPDPGPRRSRVEALREAAAAHFNAALAQAVPEVLLGYRPVTADGYPLIGETSLRGLFILSGTRRDGLHLSPVYAADMAERLLTGRGFIAGFEPERQ